MKKTFLLIPTMLALFFFGIQQINARNLYEKFPYTLQSDHGKSLKVTEHKITDKSTDSSSDIFFARNSYSTGALNISIIRLEELIKADYEKEFHLEQWMLDVNNDNWTNDAEEPLKLEGWMLDVSDWL